MRDEDYLVFNLNKIATELKHINWNLGKLVAVQLEDMETLNKILKTEREDKKKDD